MLFTWDNAVALLSLASLLSDAVAARHPTRNKVHFRSPAKTYSGYQGPYDTILSSAQCAVPLPPAVQAPKRNIWARLTQKETTEIHKWWYRQPFSNKTNIHDIELIVPNKTDALNYFDHNGPQPARYAIITTNTRPGTADWSHPVLFNKKISDGIKDIAKDLWNLTEHEYEFYPGQDPPWQYDNKITEWSQYWALPTSDFDSGDLLPLGLYYKATYDLYYMKPETWRFEGWLYNDIFYPTTEDFRKAWQSPGFEKLGPNLDGKWTHTDQKGPAFPLDKQYAPPMPVAQDARYSVDVKENYVEWMGFSFYVTFRTETGMTLYDIRFKGERILYELGVQEALAHYAGNDPVQSGTAYLDSYYDLGYANELMPGFDCPTYATYLNITFGGYSLFHSPLCLFEFDADYSIQRHAYSSNTKNIYFVLRTITTVGNYDYSFSYEFYFDGSIQVVVRAAGYIQSAYWAKNQDYGYHIHDNLSGSMHDHVLNFKADFDILGTNNTMELVTVTPVTENYVWSDQPRNTMKLVRSDISSEDESRLFWAQNGQTQYRIVNKDKPNKYGEYRGYRILPSQGTIHLAVNNSSNLVNAANWANYDLQITKQKDTEPRSATPLNRNNVYDPLINFDDFFDGESLEQEDLVVWFNLGMHHIPHTGDLPNTVYTTAHSAIQITPSNYFAYDQSRDTVNMIRLYGRGGDKIKTFGQAEQICWVNLTGLTGY